jgi:hypothetical protein
MAREAVELLPTLELRGMSEFAPPPAIAARSIQGPTAADRPTGLACVHTGNVDTRADG